MEVKKVGFIYNEYPGFYTTKLLFTTFKYNG